MENCVFTKLNCLTFKLLGSRAELNSEQVGQLHGPRDESETAGP